MDLISHVDKDIEVVGTIEFVTDPEQLKEQLQLLRKDSFKANERIVIIQRTVDHYPFIDACGSKLIELQKIVNQVDIGNCFILILTHNPNIQTEIAEVNTVYSSDTTLFESCVYPGKYTVTVPAYKNTACKKLWNHLYIGTDSNVLPCCVADHRYPLGNINNQSIDSLLDSDRAKKIRQWMIDGYRTKCCSVCYKKEDNNIQSIRQEFEPTSIKRQQIKYLDVRLNNICNFKCRMCSEYFSSSIQQETIDIFGKDAVLGYEKISLDSNNRKNRQNNLKKLLPYVTSDLERIYFAGGEPFITEEHYDILDQLIAVKNFDITIGYNTNLSRLTYKNNNIFDYWKQFSNISVGASIDASGQVAEYMRHGTVWQDIINNIDAIKTETPHVNLVISSTVSWPTLENLIELQTHWIDTSFFTRDQLRITTLVEPGYFSVTTLSDAHKKRMTIKIDNHIDYIGQCKLAQSWVELKNFMNSTNTQYELSEFTKRTVTLDKHRKESFADIFPQFTDLFLIANNLQT
jgi:molybdenum cofactor biosynthesis enzyme MoaA